MVFGSNLSLVTFRLTMQSMDFNRKLSTSASATLPPECLIANFMRFVQIPSFLLRATTLLFPISDGVGFTSFNKIPIYRLKKKISDGAFKFRRLFKLQISNFFWVSIWPLFWENENYRKYVLLFYLEHLWFFSFARLKFWIRFTTQGVNFFPFIYCISFFFGRGEEYCTDISSYNEALSYCILTFVWAFQSLIYVTTWFNLPVSIVIVFVINDNLFVYQKIVQHVSHIPSQHYSTLNRQEIFQ